MFFYDSLSRARQLRRECAGALDHVTSHGERREDILLGDDDRREWLEVVGTVVPESARILPHLASPDKGEEYKPQSGSWNVCEVSHTLCGGGHERFLRSQRRSLSG